jgi:hypothetical protein
MKHADQELSILGSFTGKEATLAACSYQEDEDLGDFNAKTERR